MKLNWFTDVADTRFAEGETAPLTRPAAAPQSTVYSFRSSAETDFRLAIPRSRSPRQFPVGPDPREEARLAKAYRKALRAAEMAAWEEASSPAVALNEVPWNR